MDIIDRQEKGNKQTNKQINLLFPIDRHIDRQLNKYMKHYFEKHMKEKLTSTPTNLPQTLNPTLPKPSITPSSEQQFTWTTKPNPSNSKSPLLLPPTKRPLINFPKNFPPPHPSHSLKQVPQLTSNQETINANQNNSHSDHDDCRTSSITQNLVKQRGFSLEYLKMTKRHKVKSMLQVGLGVKGQKRRQRVKTMFEGAFNWQAGSGKAQTQMRVNGKENEKLLMSLNQKLGKSKNSQELPSHTLYNPSPSQKALTTTSAFHNCPKKPLKFFKKFINAQEQFFSTNPFPPLSSQQPNLPISFIPLDSIRLDSTRYVSHTITKNNKTERRQGNFSFNKTFLRKSKYSPFKSRNGSSASNNNNGEIIMGDDGSKVKVKSFDESEGVKQQQASSSSVKELKRFRTTTRHKRLQSEICDKSSHKDERKDSMERKDDLAPSINSSPQTSRIISQGLLGNIKLLHQLMQCFNLQQTPPQPQKASQKLSEITQLIKTYVFGQKRSQVPTSQQQPKYPNHLFPHIDQIFLNEEDRITIRQVACVQRLLVICVVDLMGKGRLVGLFQEVKLTIRVLLSVYLKVVKQVKEAQGKGEDGTSWKSEEDTTYMSTLLTTPTLHTHYPIPHHLHSQLLPYLNNLYRNSRQLYQTLLHQQIQHSKTRTINRSFYEILRKYAIYLTNNEQHHLAEWRGSLTSNFTTCPAPYVLSKPMKRYTLCIDLDQTLLYSKFSNTTTFTTLYRPGAKELIIQLSKHFQIIIFTSSVKEYADEVIKPFVQFVDHVLYRWHVTRGRTTSVKDLSRIGRKLEKIVFVDDLEENGRLQQGNHVRVKQWKGEAGDTELIVVKKMLLKVGRDQEECEDLRVVVGGIMEKLKLIREGQMNKMRDQ